MIKAFGLATGLLVAATASAQFPGYSTIGLVARSSANNTAPSISSDGSLIAYYTSDGGSGYPAIKLWTAGSGAVTISTGVTGGVSRPFISRDGAYVVFYGCSSSGFAAQPYYFQVGGTSPVAITTASSVMTVDDTTDSPSVSDATNGTRYFAYRELATTVVKGVTSHPQIIVWNQTANTKAVASVVGTTKANNPCKFAVINADGTRVAFTSTATNLVSGMSGQQVYYSRLTTGWNVTDCPSNTMGDTADWPSISAAGTELAFQSNTGSGVPIDVYMWGPSFSAFQPYPSNGAPSGVAKWTTNPSISPDGQYVAFTSDRGLDSALDNTDTYLLNGVPTQYTLVSVPYSYVCDTSTGTCTLLSYRVSTNKKARVGLYGAVSNNADYAAFFASSDRIYDTTYPSFYEIYLRS